MFCQKCGTPDSGAVSCPICGGRNFAAERPENPEVTPPAATDASSLSNVPFSELKWFLFMALVVGGTLLVINWVWNWLAS
jgi:hypothetical protein